MYQLRFRFLVGFFILEGFKLVGLPYYFSYDHQHSLHTKKQKRTQYQLGHKEHHSLPYNAYADVYTDLPCNMMDYGKDQAKKRRSKKTKKSHR